MDIHAGKNGQERMNDVIFTSASVTKRPET
jgi:hypothetical protein